MQPAADPASAVPAWLREVLPRWWLARPAFTEAVWAALVALRNGILTVFGAAAAFAPHDALRSPLAFLCFVGAHWWGIVAPFVLSYLRAHQAFAKARGPA